MLYADFTGFGRVLATKVFIPEDPSFRASLTRWSTSARSSSLHTDEAAMDVMNTLKEYRGVETGVKWAHRSLVESIKELRQRQVGNEADGRGMGGEAIPGIDERRRGGDYGSAPEIWHPCMMRILRTPGAKMMMTIMTMSRLTRTPVGSFIPRTGAAVAPGAPGVLRRGMYSRGASSTRVHGTSRAGAGTHAGARIPASPPSES